MLLHFDWRPTQISEQFHRRPDILLHCASAVLPRFECKTVEEVSKRIIHDFLDELNSQSGLLPLLCEAYPPINIWVGIIGSLINLNRMLRVTLEKDQLVIRAGH
jgi:hypothetical protein